MLSTTIMERKLERVVDIVQCLLGIIHVTLEILNVGIHSVLVLGHLLFKAPKIITMFVHHIVAEVKLDFNVGELSFQVIHDGLL